MVMGHSEVLAVSAQGYRHTSTGVTLPISSTAARDLAAAFDRAVFRDHRVWLSDLRYVLPTCLGFGLTLMEMF